MVDVGDGDRESARRSRLRMQPSPGARVPAADPEAHRKWGASRRRAVDSRYPLHARVVRIRRTEAQMDRRGHERSARRVPRGLDGERVGRKLGTEWQTFLTSVQRPAAQQRIGELFKQGPQTNSDVEQRMVACTGRLPPSNCRHRATVDASHGNLRRSTIDAGGGRFATMRVTGTHESRAARGRRAPPATPPRGPVRIARRAKSAPCTGCYVRPGVE